MMANYFLSGTLDNPRVIIPTKHLKVTEKGYERKHSEARSGDVTMSQTTKCRAYEFKHHENPSKFIFFDTPGMSDTKGIEQEDKNIQEIVDTAIGADSLSAIIIIANGSEARVTPVIKNTLVRMANNLPDNIYNNLLLILTKCTKASACFSDEAFAKDIAKPKEVFYMDNQVFCADPRIWGNEEDEEYCTIKLQWDKSYKTIKNLLKIITEMGPISTEPFGTMKNLRDKIKSEITQVSQTITNIQQVQDSLDAAQKALQITGDKKNEFADYTRTEHITLRKIVASDDHSTICITHLRDNIICHEHCGLEFTAQAGANTFSHCICMGDGTTCRECGCGPTSHVHDKIKLVTETKTIQKILEDMKAEYDMADQQHERISADANNYQATFANLQAAVDANYNKIHKLCMDLNKICSRFNFVEELSANIENMRQDASAIQNVDIRTKAESEIKMFEKLVSDLSSMKM